MASSVNLVVLLGNLTKDPELRFTPNGQAVANATVATNRVWKDKETGEKKEQAEFTSLVFWGKTAEVASQFLKKGSQVHVQGRLQTRSWDDEHGGKHWKTEVVVTELTFLRRSEPSASTEVAPDEVVLPVDQSAEAVGEVDLAGEFDKSQEKGKIDGQEQDVIDPDEIPF